MPNTISRTEIEETFGRLDDLRLAEILDTGATTGELAEARRWSQGDKRTIPAGENIRPSVVNRICDIMKADEPEWYDTDTGNG